MFNIVLITGSRAEYGILKPLIRRLKEDVQVELYIVACAMHMEEKYGYTYKTIEEDGYDIDLKIPMNLSNTKNVTILTGMSILQNKLAEYYEKNNFDLTIILGDRYEMLSVANVSVINKVPICHIHGGEKTLGNYDEFIRHAITKMSHIHFAATDEYKKRIIQLGEDPLNVYNIGAMGVENVLNEQFIKKHELEKMLKIEELNDYFVVLFHPVTLEPKESLEIHVKELIEAVTNFTDIYKFIFIGSNSDSGSDEIQGLVNNFVEKNLNVFYFSSLSTVRYHSLIKNSLGLIGNSSSGIIECPSLNIWTINIGNRQEGRVMGESIINVQPNKKEIKFAINKVINSKERNFSNPYYQCDSSAKAYEIIINALKQGINIKKIFFDIEDKN